ncbi:MAG: 1-deoxy-D-xylulose-5-phosphate reductoisomerase [Patescibacteria group bacterium]
MKTIAIFGSTGSIGRQSLEVIENSQDFKVTFLTAHKNQELLNEQSEKFNSEQYLGDLNEDIISEVVKTADIIINAIPGFNGIYVSLEALKNGKILLSGNKESLAVAGKFLIEIAKDNGGEIRPLDSEASAIWQLLNDYKEDVSSITLTCSGGPFFGKKKQDLESVTIKEALQHPTWKMGPKVSLDSATLVNKVLEVFEIKNLFNLDISKINIVIHRQSVVHSMVHTKTGATKMQISQNDMRLPIFYALNWPVKKEYPWPPLRIRKSELNFAPADKDTFLPLKWLALHGANPNFPVILNAANDVAVAKFLAGEIKFLEIYDIIETALSKWILEVPIHDLTGLIEFHNKISNECCNNSSGRKIHTSKAR